MLDSERTFKIKVRLCLTVFEILLTSAIIFTWRVLHGNETIHHLQNYKRHKSGKGHSRKPLQSSTSYIEIENTETTRLVFKDIEFCPIFDILIDITLAIFREKLQNHTRKPTEVSQNTPTFISIGPPITK